MQFSSLGTPLFMFWVRGPGWEEHPPPSCTSTLLARPHLSNAGDGPDFVVGILPAVVQSGRACISARICGGSPSPRSLWPSGLTDSKGLSGARRGALRSQESGLPFSFRGKRPPQRNVSLLCGKEAGPGKHMFVLGPSNCPPLHQI